MAKKNVNDSAQHIIHLSAECYPVAKVGGLGDVVGALPKYLQQAGLRAWVVMPWYNKPFVKAHDFDVIYTGSFLQGSRPLEMKVLKEKSNVLGFGLYLIHIPGLLDREDPYGYSDESEQFMAFQHGFLHWITQAGIIPDVVHCHDHHTGLIPFLMYHSERFAALKDVPTVATVHNGQYQGWMDWNKAILLPAFDTWKWGLLDWDKTINPLAALIKCATVFTTVSEGYLQELMTQANGLEQLFNMERAKSIGIVNGIDTAVWNPEQDTMLIQNYRASDVQAGKMRNKAYLSDTYGLDASKPLLAYIGRFAGEKGADLLPEIIENIFADNTVQLSVMVLGSGDLQVQTTMTYLAEKYPGKLGIYIGYQEELAHRIYAAADFLIMPSRVEPCGLNQLYSMQYGTLPIVRSTGGLKDTVHDISEPDGYGITFVHASAADAVFAIYRALELYRNKQRMQQLRKQLMKIDFSWDKSADKYIALYQNITE
ncbi:glycogen synthase [Parapedobacter pyrenivorans]|uniref:Glycogen synthase n=1 Tax=Parapedobacter pyrenivorans TaxID=1305674 RepID=A0A917M934_9SPHI|nr:glycogen/starch synthase [Parapedobacter pyrenivorans]GGG85221.1 glycogen synthase [Parapedobacter pyrenivorans]